MSRSMIQVRILLSLTSGVAVAATGLRAQDTRFFDNFSNGNAQGWTLGPERQIGPAQASGAWGCALVGDPGFDADGVAAGVVIGGVTTSI